MNYERQRLSDRSPPPAPRKARPLALSDSQLQLVMAGAGGLLPSARTKFLEAVADMLLAEPEITDAAVALAIAATLARFNFDGQNDAA